MLKSEYDRKYLWHNDNDKDQFYMKKRTNDERFSEPHMTHKRRVKLAEDNVVIGEPLPHQNTINDKSKYNYPWQELKFNKKKEKQYEKRNVEKHQKQRLINEFVQTDDGLREKSTQISKSVPNILKEVAFIHHKNEKIGKDMKKIDKYSQMNGNEHRNNINEVKQRDNHLEAKQNHKLSSEFKKCENNEYKSFVNINEKQKKNNNKENDKGILLKYSKEIQLPIPAKSEYQTRYAWCDTGIDQQPKSARNAQMMSSWDTKLKIYNNFISEYQRQFRPYEFVTENKYKKMKPTFEKHHVVDDINLKFVPDKRRAVTPPPDINLNKKSYKIGETMNPQRMSFPHGKHKRFLTEYSANFDNKWDKLDAEMQKNIEEKAREANSQAKWFQEILELRKKAQEYRQRSRGTHFSREHLGQVFSKSRNKSDDESSIYEEKKRLSPYRGRHESCREFINSKTKNNCNSVTNSTCSSFVNNGSIHSSNDSIIKVKPRSRSQSPIRRARTAGKPTNDDSLLLDEEASHDTNVKSIDRPYSSEVYVSQYPQHHRQDNNNTCQVKNERQYTLEKYLNMSKDDSKKMKTIDYESVSKHSSKGQASTRSLISSSTMSLALETLERAKRNRDEVLRQKS